MTKRDFCEIFALHSGAGYPAKDVVQQAIDLYDEIEKNAASWKQALDEKEKQKE